MSVTNILQAAFFVQNCFLKLFCNISLRLHCFGKTKLVKKQLKKWRWNKLRDSFKNWQKSRLVTRPCQPFSFVRFSLSPLSFSKKVFIIAELQQPDNDAIVSHCFILYTCFAQKNKEKKRKCLKTSINDINLIATLFIITSNVFNYLRLVS